MKKRFFVGLIFTLLILFAYAGCATKCPDNGGNGLPPPPPPPPPEGNWVPLTITVLRQVLNNNNNDWDGTLRAMHFRISVGITLDRIFTESEMNLLGGAIHSRIVTQEKPLILDSNSIGEGLGGHPGNSQKFFLSVGFDNRDQRIPLQFSNVGDHRDEFFYLDYAEDKSVIGKGTIDYGLDDDRHQYIVKYDGNRTPYLLVDLRERIFNRREVTNISRTTVEGRR